MAPPLLHLRDIDLTFGGTPLLQGVELSVTQGERVCLVGRNGSGKSTLLKIAAGLVEPDGGEHFVQPGATLRYLAQEPDLTGFHTTLDYAQAGLGPGDDPYRAQYLLNELGLGGSERPDTLSGGEARRAALARALAPAPDILLLDEPTNHLDLPAIEWLEAELSGLRSAIVIISHDRRFLETLSRVTVWLDRGMTRRLEQGFSAFEAWRDNVLEEEERDQHKLARKIAAEEDWVRYGVTARRKRNVRRMAELQDLRRQRREHRQAQGAVKLEASEAEISGKLVIEAKSICKNYGELVVVRNFSTRIQRGDRIGIIGANGAGKTTLLGLLTGTLSPDEGSVRLGTNLEIAMLDQRRQSLEPGWTLTEALTRGAGDTVMVGGRPRHVVSYMKDFLFSPEQARTSVSVLSGGERGRLMLARVLAQPSNLLVLDEPTNDLDLETLDLLEEMIADYSGTVLVVSHDRDFLDRVATSVLVAEEDGRWQEYAGGYSDMVVQRGYGVRAPVADKPRVRRKSAEQKSGAREAASPQRRKLSFKDKHALETLPDRIADLEGQAAKLQAVLAEQDLFSREPERFSAAVAELERVQVALGMAEEQWLALEMLREEIES